MAWKAAPLLLRSAFVLLCKLLLVDVVCAFVSSWICYFLVRKTLAPAPNSNNGRSQDNNGIQVIICGFPRSGSTSLRQAMDILGFPCFHGAHLYKPSTAKLFLKVQASGTHQEWKDLMHGYKSIVDGPAASSYRELLDIYPNAKVILNVRDPNKWYNSFSQTILTHSQSLVVQVVQPYIARCSNAYFKILIDKPESKELTIRSYKRHVEEIQRHVPSQKLYIFDLEKNEGWGPLCEFLEVPIPNVPLPFSNKRDDFSKMLQKHRTIHGIVLFSYLAILFSVITIGRKWALSM